MWKVEMWMMGYLATSNMPLAVLRKRLASPLAAHSRNMAVPVVAWIGHRIGVLHYLLRRAAVGILAEG